MERKIAAAQVELEMSEELVSQLEEQLKAAIDNPRTVEDTFTAVLKEMMIEENPGHEPISDEDEAKLVDFVVQSLRNHAIKRAGKSKFQFSPYMMGLAMDKFLQGTTAYERERETSPFVLPSPSTLKKKKIGQTVTEGDSVELYERIKMFMSTPEMIGQLICDEMKVKGDIAFCVQSNTVKGFTADFASA